MDVFISWSKTRSRAVAEILRDWLPQIIQSVRPWISSQDIDAGRRGVSEIADRLRDYQFGILCLTPENLASPWIHFEAGALSKTLDQAFVCPYLHKVAPEDIRQPLGQFQWVHADKDGTKRVVRSIYKAGKIEYPEWSTVEKMIDRVWPEMQRQLAAIPSQDVAAPEPREDRDMLVELLEGVRLLLRDRSKAHEFRIVEGRPKGLLEFAFPREQEVAAGSLADKVKLADLFSRVSWELKPDSVAAEVLQEAVDPATKHNQDPQNR